ncbi:Na+/H+ antiporter NhaC [Faecalicatena acetigenes]|jgi:NhaC family Na+:H+ antiporter|uniref:Na+/H+ antiporter NhaC n=1 Tax=Faecalicatena acetigenes TaxID=2981790 RepID=A0ABT2TAA0_9FIRM|nr:MULTISPECIES: Na+/H+ antiporter NhaC [Lachnospiraceae]MCU6747166.1 Na+/H+ antiporter NhaC [Faecalicatena acetigenes]SCH69139.1 Malate-2H(+)/Na(+)-lactate antiporter [uncultured Clostridium sp.]
MKNEKMTERKRRIRREPKVWQALLALVCVIAAVVAAIRGGVGIQMGLAMGGCIAIVFALLMGNRWEDIQNTIKRVVGDSATTLLILISVGMMVGIWIIGGTVPTLLYYGLKLCSPAVITPLTFVLCAITSLFTGSSFGSIATMGLALFGVGISMDISAPLMAGAVCSGAFFGDKLSPLSDTTNVAADMSGTRLYDHIGSMMYTTVPATIVCLILYTVLGLKSASANADLSSVQTIMTTLDSNFNISILALIPALLVLITSAMKMPAVPAMLGCTAVSGVFACVLQKASLSEVLGAAMNGFVSETGVEMVDKILSRGGMISMYGTVAIIILSATMGAVLEKSGVIECLVKDVLLKAVHKPRGLILSTMVYCYSLLFISGHQVMPIILGGRTFRPAYDKMGIQSRVLSRTLEDTCTIGAPLVPWGTSCAYMYSVLGIGIAYIPYAFLSFIVPLFAILYACTGWFIWRKEPAAEAETA